MLYRSEFMLPMISPHTLHSHGLGAPLNLKPLHWLLILAALFRHPFTLAFFLSCLLFLLPNLSSFAHERYGPRSPAELPLGTLQDQGVRVLNARVLYLNLPGLRRYFPNMVGQLEHPGMSAPQVWQSWATWLKRNFAFISKAQLLLSGVRHSSFSVDLNNAKTFYRPIYSEGHRYSRAAVEEAFDLAGNAIGMLDIKGAGYAEDLINSHINPQIRDLQQAGGNEEIIARIWTRDHNDGLVSGGEAIAERTRQLQIQTAFDIENAKNGTDFQTTEVLFLMDLGIEIFRPRGHIPAFLCGREVHWGRNEMLKVPASIYTDEHGRMQHTYFNAAIDFGGARIHYGNYAHFSRALDGSNSIDPQINRVWGLSHDAALTAVREGSDAAIVRHLERMSVDHTEEREEWIKLKGPGPYSELELKRKALIDQVNKGELGDFMKFLQDTIHSFPNALSPGASEFLRYLFFRIPEAKAKDLFWSLGDYELETLFSFFRGSIPETSLARGKMPLPPWFFSILFQSGGESTRGTMLEALHQLVKTESYPLRHQLQEMLEILGNNDYSVDTRKLAFESLMIHSPKNSALLETALRVAQDSSDRNMSEQAVFAVHSLKSPDGDGLLMNAIRKCSSLEGLRWQRRFYLDAISERGSETYLQFTFEMIDGELARTKPNLDFLNALTLRIRRRTDASIVEKARQLLEAKDGSTIGKGIGLDLIEYRKDPESLQLLMQVLDSEREPVIIENAYETLLQKRVSEIPSEILMRALDSANANIRIDALHALSGERFQSTLFGLLQQFLREQSLRTESSHQMSLNIISRLAQNLSEPERTALTAQAKLSENPKCFHEWAIRIGVASRQQGVTPEVRGNPEGIGQVCSSKLGD